MAARTEAEIQADIDAIKKAMLALASGNVVKSLTVGSDDLQRRYSYQEISESMLIRLLQMYEKELEAVLSPGEIEGFTTNCRTHGIRIDRGL